MKKTFFNLKFIIFTMTILLTACVSDDLADVGDLQDFTGPTPFFSFEDVTSAQFDCADQEIAVDYELSFTAGSNLAVNGTDYLWSVTPLEGVSLVNSQIPILERQIEAELATVLAIEEDIAELEVRIPCEEDPARVVVFEAEIAALEIALDAANAALSQEALDNVANLEAQMAALPAATMQDRELIFNFPAPGTYTISLVVTDNLGESEITQTEVTINQAVPTIPTPEISEPSFEDGSLFDGTGDGRDSWRTPSNAAWSPLGGGTTVPQINGNSEEGRVPDGLQSAKFPSGGDRVAYQEIEVTPGAEYVLTYFSEFEDSDDVIGTQTVSILVPETAGYMESLIPENIIATRTDTSVGRIEDVFQQHALTFAAGDNESVIIYATNTGLETRLDAFAITVRQ